MRVVESHLEAPTTCRCASARRATRIITALTMGPRGLTSLLSWTHACCCCGTYACHPPYTAQIESKKYYRNGSKLITAIIKSGLQTSQVQPKQATTPAHMAVASMKTMTAKQKVQVTFANITYDVLDKHSKPKRILSGITGHASPGEVLAIMGSSGAGKTTLLNSLSGRFVGGRIGGTISANGIEINDRRILRRASAFVTQDDLMLETQTPREVIQFSAAMRLGPTVTSRERAELVADVIKLLHLGNCADTLVGTIGQGGISGGERKRTNVGVEMVTNPTIVYVDEPTSGLDSYTALRVMQALKDVALGGRTVVTTIHQPASECVGLVDTRPSRARSLGRLFLPTSLPPYLPTSLPPYLPTFLPPTSYLLPPYFLPPALWSEYLACTESTSPSTTSCCFTRAASHTLAIAQRPSHTSRAWASRALLTTTPRTF